MSHLTAMDRARNACDVACMNNDVPIGTLAQALATLAVAEQLARIVDALDRMAPSGGGPLAVPPTSRGNPEGVNFDDPEW